MNDIQRTLAEIIYRRILYNIERDTLLKENYLKAYEEVTKREGEMRISAERLYINSVIGISVGKSRELLKLIDAPLPDKETLEYYLQKVEPSMEKYAERHDEFEESESTNPLRNIIPYLKMIRDLWSVESKLQIERIETARTLIEIAYARPEPKKVVY